MDGRNSRRDTSRQRAFDAIERLAGGSGSYASNAGPRVGLSRKAVAKEAGISLATLYRLPEVCAAIDRAKPGTTKRASATERLRTRSINRLRELERQRVALVTENLRLARELFKFRPDLVLGTVVPMPDNLLGPGESPGFESSFLDRLDRILSDRDAQEL